MIRFILCLIFIFSQSLIHSQKDRSGISLGYRIFGASLKTEDKCNQLVKFYPNIPMINIACVSANDSFRANSHFYSKNSQQVIFIPPCLQPFTSDSLFFSFSNSKVFSYLALVKTQLCNASFRKRDRFKIHSRTIRTFKQ